MWGKEPVDILRKTALGVGLTVTGPEAAPCRELAQCTAMGMHNCHSYFTCGKKRDTGRLGDRT